MASQRDKAMGIQKGFSSDGDINYSLALPIGAFFVVFLLVLVLLYSRKSKK
ncbi:MAG: hypothetical protein J0L93_06525 [Deltaproteobacteria bacterium]|nr:hypothetical protein [Deltaproteobacteria bacterium]